LIAQLVRELAQVQEQLLVREQELAQVQLLVREQELGLELQLVQARLLVLVLELQQVQVQLLVLASELVQHPPHQPLQSLFQRQRSRLLQHEFLSTLRQLAKALQYQLCL
jgi:hypothetical protein